MGINDRAIRAVLFDKNGTLIAFYASWVGAELLAARELCALADHVLDDLAALVPVLTARLAPTAAIAGEQSVRTGIYGDP